MMRFTAGWPQRLLGAEFRTKSMSNGRAMVRIYHHSSCFMEDLGRLGCFTVIAVEQLGSAVACRPKSKEIVNTKCIFKVEIIFLR